MSTVGYISRDMTGTTLQGVFPEGNPAQLDVSRAKDISLNLGRSEIESFARRGADLHIVLANGETLVLDNYFSFSGTGGKNLFLSTDGQFVEVVLEDKPDGMLFASYETLDLSGKWSAYDDLVFLDVDRIEPVIAPIAAPLLGGLGTAGVAAGVVGTAVLVNDDGTPTSNTPPAIQPTVDDPDASYPIAGSSTDPVVITGTGTPGSEVRVLIGDHTETVIIGDDGTWTATIAIEDLPPDGNYDTTVEVTDPDGNDFDLDGPTVVIDTTPPEAEVTSGTQSTGDIVNAVIQADGPVISGTGEPGASLNVRINGVTERTTVNDDGTWSVTFDPADIPTGEYETSVRIRTTDEFGNRNTYHDVLVVDTVAPPIGIDTVEGDNSINFIEASDGVILTGTGEAGATISVEFQGATRTTTVGSDGTWSVRYGTNAIAEGVYDSTIEVTSTDAAGNSSTETHTVHIDTETRVIIDTPVAGDNVINATEQAGGVTLTGLADPGATVEVTFQGITRTVTADSSGNWSAAYAASEIADGEYDATVSVTATDTSGNTETTSSTVHIDTENAVTLDTGFAGGDNDINFIEASNGITLTGTGEAGATISVEFQGTTRTTTVASDGTWSMAYDASEIASGIYDSTIEVTSTDAAGNSATASHTVHIDTETRVTIDSPIAGDDVINNAEQAGGVTLTGLADPGATVEVTFQGITRTVTADSSGTWSAAYAASDIADGEYDATVSVTATDSSGNTETTSSTVHIDTENAVTLDTGFAGGDNDINFIEASNGITLTGTGEAGATISVEFQGTTRTTTVASDGTWSMAYDASEIASGIYDSTIEVTSTDAAGNSATASHTVHIDTETRVTIDSPIAGDDVINNAEQAGGVTLTGLADPGATVEVTFQGITRTVTADSSGTWSAAYAASDIADGEYDATVSVTATDSSGNTASTSTTVGIDTQTSVTLDAGSAGGDNTVNQAEAQAGLTLSGVAEPGATVDVTLAGVTRQATVDANGNWSATFEAGAIAPGEYNTAITVNSTDAAGNTAAASAALRVDTVAGTVTLSPDPVELDDIINATERANGVEISGTATPGLTVTVGLGAATNQVVADINGNWSTTFLPAQVPTGEAQLPITASIVDSAGNTASVSDSVALDTLVDPLTMNTTGIEGDNIVNAVEHSNGVTLTGTVEPGSAVQVQMGSVTHNAVVDNFGNWTASFAASDIPTGTYDAAISVLATDAAGNTATTSHTLAIDTEIAPFTVVADQTADDVVNLAERNAGVTLTGTVETGSTVEVTIGGVTRTATVDGSGNWSADFDAADIPLGDYSATATITATDAAGNTQSLTESFAVDTIYTTPDVDSVTFSSGDVRRISTEGVTDSYTVSALESDGSVTVPTATITQDPVFGTEFTFSTPVPDGTHLVITSEDTAGNASSTLVVLEDNATNSGTMDHAGLSQFNIDDLHLGYASDVSLSLTESDIKALSGNSNTLTVHGGSGDTLTVAGAAAAGTQSVDGQAYNVYTIGNDGTTLLVDQDINVLI
ncbi:Ig-like domain-containing protein [Phaeobacter sp. PT47_59]|uniref:Ig-like domain-containing protein n=1 Tax=Phaeobacter sp. PT47_59 TaxID=3029979 RepID=UPI00238010F7|nr:Ig-like domain-containing protein [Phaeobacter sp. PT47_59]MDE4175863.1 Ig-like domain-containing protein [Phaeobacter sp. PT47_59]